MVTRTYDLKLTVDNSAGFVVGNTILGNTSATSALIVGVEPNILKVTLSNVLQEFSSSEEIHSNSVIVSGTTSGQLNNGLVPFVSNTAASEVTTAAATISAIEFNRFTTAKNADTQNPIVRLISIYYPGEWYPPNLNGNPSNAGEGRAWPNGFPIQIAQVVGATNEDIGYNVIFNGEVFIPAPINLSGIDQSSDGKINELTIEIFNVGNIISSLVENPYLSGNNISNSVVALVNDEFVHGIDPRTVNATPDDVGSPGDEAFDTLTRARANGLAFSAAIVSDVYGIANATFTFEQTAAVNGTWRNDTFDSRDLLGGIVNIKTTFAQFLDFWPEYSIITQISSNAISVKNSAPYRVGDNLISTVGSIEGTILSIDSNNTIYLSNALDAATQINTPLYIVNPEADVESYLDDTYKIDQLESLSDQVASFGLVSWLQYFKSVLPKRRYYKNTCQWQYKGAECQYPESGTGTIPGTVPAETANGFFTNNNVSTSDPTLDVCSKSFAACSLRRNTIHFGGFPGTGRQVPRL
jgi:phage-related protein